MYPRGVDEQTLTGAPTRRFLHVANGTCTTRLIEAAGISGVRSIWADPLYEGPVPEGLSDGELLVVRARFLAGSAGAVSAAWAGPDPALNPANDLREWRAVIERHESYDELILWFEHDLFDQLNLIQLLTWVRECVPATKPVSLICVDAFPGRDDFKGLGQLTPGELATLMEARQQVGASHYALAKRAWLAFRAPTPEALDRLRGQETAALPFLAPAITRFLQEYPSTRDGLSRTERRLLELAGADGISLATAFPRMHDGEEVYYVTDSSLAALARTLAATSPALLTFDASEVDRAAGLRGRVMLTDAGRLVLSGGLDRVTACGIDRWLGGVHLQTDATVWRWDDARQRIV